MCSLRALASNDFRDIAGTWSTELLQEGSLYRDCAAGHTYLCLGYNFQTAFLWQTLEPTPFFQLSEQDLDLADCRERFRTVSLTDVVKPEQEASSPWKGIPTQVCSWAVLVHVSCAMGEFQPSANRALKFSGILCVI